MNNSNPSPAPQKNSPSGGEMYVGLNILSKIGVIFIIIGVIAFSAVSDGYIPAWGRLAMILALGAVMTLLGELFRRGGSVVFAGSLTFGGIAELFVCSLVGRFGFEVIGDGALVIGAVTAAAGLLLSLRYKSQPLLIVTVIGAFLPIWAVETWVGYFISAVFLAAVFAGASIICQRRELVPAKFVGVLTAVAEGIFLYFKGNSLRKELLLDAKIHNAQISTLNDLTGIFASVFVIIVLAMYAGGAVLKSTTRCGGINKANATLLVLSQAFAMLLPLAFLGGKNTAAGIIVLVLAVAYTVCAVMLSLALGRGCRTEQIFENLLMTALSVGILSLFPDMFSYMVFHVFAAAVIVAGLFQNKKLWLGWGYGALGFAELFFLSECVTQPTDPLFVWTYVLNTVVWIVVMAVFAAKGRRGALVNIYSWAVLLNTAIFGIYMVFDRISAAIVAAHLLPNGVTNISRGLSVYRLLLTVAVWMITGFAAGKLKYMKKASAAASITFYSLGMFVLFVTNVTAYFNSWRHLDLGVAAIIIYIAVNVVSVLSALDMALRIKSLAPKFARAVGLVTSFYALMTLTVTLDLNGWAAFTSCIISIIYILTAAAWIGIGFAKYNALLRRFGLALALFSSAKLFLFDFPAIDAMGRTLMFIGFGVTLLCISFVYAFFEKRLKNKTR
ncbi:MAG: DUF2339 domain-containing protein [Oscillospiraceae bacterium]